MKKIFYIGTDKWSFQFSQLAKSEEFLIAHAVIPTESKHLREICEQSGIPYWMS